MAEAGEHVQGNYQGQSKRELISRREGKTLWLKIGECYLRLPETLPGL